MTTVVTGCGGLLGSELCRQLDRLAVGVDLPDFDLTNRSRLLATLYALRPRVVVNTAAYTLVDRAETERDACWAVNTQGVAILADACQQLDCTLVQISTSYVFGHRLPGHPPLRENDEPSPCGVYAQSKWEAEQCASRTPRHVIVRTCGLYGRPTARSPERFVESILAAARLRQPLRVVHDQHCTPTYVPHLACGIRHLIASGATGVYHITNAGSATWFEFAREILNRSNMDVDLTPVTTADWRAAAPRPAYSVLDCTKYHRLAGAPSMPSWQDALAEYLSQRIRSAM